MLEKISLAAVTALALPRFVPVDQAIQQGSPGIQAAKELCLAQLQGDVRTELPEKPFATSDELAFIAFAAVVEARVIEITGSSKLDARIAVLLKEGALHEALDAAFDQDVSAFGDYRCLTQAELIDSLIRMCGGITMRTLPIHILKDAAEASAVLA